MGWKKIERRGIGERKVIVRRIKRVRERGNRRRIRSGLEKRERRERGGRKRDRERRNMRMIRNSLEKRERERERGGIG